MWGLLGTIVPMWQRWLAFIVLLFAAYSYGAFHQALRDEAARNEAFVEHQQEIDTHVANYIRKVRELSDVRSTASKLVKLCRAAAGVSSPKQPTGTVGGDSGHRQVDHGAASTPSVDSAEEPTSEMNALAEDLHKAQRNKFKCQALQDVVRSQAKEKRAWYDPRRWFSKD